MSKVAESCLRRMMADNSYVCFFFVFVFYFCLGFFYFYLILMSSAQF